MVSFISKIILYTDCQYNQVKPTLWLLKRFRCSICSVSGPKPNPSNELDEKPYSRVLKPETGEKQGLKAARMISELRVHCKHARPPKSKLNPQKNPGKKENSSLGIGKKWRAKWTNKCIFPISRQIVVGISIWPLKPVEAIRWRNTKPLAEICI